jgi:hypothetical protein
MWPRRPLGSKMEPSRLFTSPVEMDASSCSNFGSSIVGVLANESANLLMGKGLSSQLGDHPGDISMRESTGKIDYQSTQRLRRLAAPKVKCSIERVEALRSNLHPIARDSNASEQGRNPSGFLTLPRSTGYTYCSIVLRGDHRRIQLPRGPSPLVRDRLLERDWILSGPNSYPQHHLSRDLGHSGPHSKTKHSLS